MLLRDGKVHRDVIRSTHVAEQELQAAARVQGCENIARVHQATLENSGRISILQ